ncbi:damage-inducible mutagenesis protein [Agrobacterium tumefaciens]|uniref:ImuA family protein n=1 Tax=Agrobacterium tumefaciens TaxID=358 RepID=UPI00157248DF|nr:ImuA family protein [Agrobacterium tumefaciens]MCZ7497229.1 ImuA family protein [Rhizobium rhizogenes]NTE56572.1 damage-inducible mutagenesis protein [Agrobacterium tumefaciens]NTE74540.1 damage-inducible mutagenesis protein [Agrobacterium tumefaciens]
MPNATANSVIAELRTRIARFECAQVSVRQVLPFGVAEVDRVLPGGGLAFGALHEVAGGGGGTVDGAAAALFVAGIAARTRGKILWCMTRPDLFFPAVAQAGLHPDRVVWCESDKEEEVLSAMEEGLSFGGLAAVVGELVRLPMNASRRLQLSAEKTGAMGIVLRRWRRQNEASDYGQPTASTTRWRISTLPSEKLPVTGVGRARWLAELMRVKAGECAEFEIGAPDAKGRICLLPTILDRADQTAHRRSLAG